MMNKKIKLNFGIIICVAIIGIVCEIIKVKTNYLISIICAVLIISILLFKDNIGKNLLATVISMTINYIIYLMAAIICYILNKCFSLESDLVNLIIIIFLHTILLYYLLKIKKFKYGITFLQKNNENEYIDILILTISLIVLFSVTLISVPNINLLMNIGLPCIIFTIIMFVTIRKSLQLYYKQKLLEQELVKAKEELESKNKEIKELEAENIKISKKAHTLTHKQKALTYKIEEMIMKSEISIEESAEVMDRLNQIGEELYKEKTTTELAKTEIPQIDDMLKYMQSECNKNKIDFELQLKGNIHYMVNNLIDKKDLETLLADHIKNAIIAINHTENVNRSILVKLGKIDETYGLYIYDSGIEFEKETLKNLGKIPSTTHKDEGGTGMGFMNTFDTLKKYNASLVIDEIGKPSKDNYTKVIKIKFDNKNEFQVKNYN